ncbi:AarF/UbiB family protein [soil metagenome]
MVTVGLASEVSAADPAWFFWPVFLATTLPAILVIAWVASRLLGVRRSPAATVLSGAVGWLASIVVSLTITDVPFREASRSSKFSDNVWLFSVVFTLLAAAGIQPFAKPGALAKAQGGLVSVPRPIRSLRQKYQRVRRYTEITRIAARHGLGPWLSGGDDTPTLTTDGGAGRSLRLALEEGGGMFVKLGQLLSTRPDVVPPGIVTELAHLRDQVAPADPEDVRSLLKDELGGAVADVFAAFDWEPLAAASIGQVYRARLKSGDEVIVKVQRPGIADAVARDIDVLATLARAAEERTTWAAEYHVADLAAEFSERLTEELDFRIEARHAADIAVSLAGLPSVHVPRVYHELTTAKVLVMEWLDGVSVGDAERVDALGVDRGHLADTLLRCSLQQMLIDGHFHADPHPGNLMVLADGRLGLIDFGAAGRLDSLQPAALREMMVAVSERDAAAMREAVLAVATLRRDYDDEQLERALARFLARHLGPGTAPSPAMFNELLQIFFAFGITLAPELTTFFRAFVTLEGSLTTLSPGFLAIDGAQQLATEWARDRFTPSALGDLARAEVVSLLPLLRRLPRHVDRIARLTERGQLTLRVRLFSDDHDVMVITTLVNRAVLAFTGGVLGILSVILLGTSGGPRLTNATSLFQFFGYIGLFLSTVLILRVLVTVLRDGLN